MSPLPRFFFATGDNSVKMYDSNTSFDGLRFYPYMNKENITNQEIVMIMFCYRLSG